MELTTILSLTLLVCLPLGGCGENFYHNDDRVLAYETTVPISGEEPFDGSFPEKSPAQPAKRSTPPTLRENLLRAKVEDVPYLTKSRGLPVPSTPSGWKETRRPRKTNQFGVFPTELTVCEGEDVVFRAWGAIGKMKNCTVLTPKKDFVQLQPPPTNPSKNSRITYYDFGADGERCGFRVRNVTKGVDWGEWNLTVTTDKVTLSLDPGMSVIDCPPNGTEEHHMLLPGEKTLVNCGPSDVTACYLEAPGGSKNTPAELQVGSCHTPEVPFSNLVAGEWTCNWVPKGSMLQRSSKADIEFAELPSDMDVGLEWRNVTSPSPMGHKPTLDLRCNFRGQSALIKMCKIAQPGGNVFYPRDGMAHGRYSYLGRGLANGDCGLSIEQPLQPEDIGLWRCEVFLFGTGGERGGFIEVGIANRTREDKLRSLKPWGPLGGAQGRVSSNGNPGTLEVMTGDSLVIGCSAEAPLTLCLIRRPDGNASAPSQLSSDGDDDLYEEYGRGEGLGDCGIRVKATQGTNHTGRWECVVSIDFGDAQVIPIDVVVHEKPLKVEIDGGAAWHGYPANFSCRSVLGVSLDHCRFERPDRTIVTVMDSRHPNAHQASWSHGLHAVSDLGAGLCSVHVPQMRDEDFGEWTCIARAQDSKKDFQLRFHVAAAGISTASAAAAAGVVLVVAVFAAIAGVAIYRRRLRQRRDGEAANIQGAGTDDSVISFRPDDEEEDSSSVG